jgi:hypothetical protein|tara:strand:- start:179 stop:850 length:672 start_codon:yes stop_codon:yes gene_type:complete
MENPHLIYLLAPVGGMKKGTPEERRPHIIKAFQFIKEEGLVLPEWLASEVLDVSVDDSSVFSKQDINLCIDTIGHGFEEPTFKKSKGFFETQVDALIKGVPAKYAHINFTPPQSVRNQASRGLELRREHGRGGLSSQQASKQGIGSGVQRASDLKSGERVSPRTVRRMLSFFKRHEVYKKKGYHQDQSSASYISWLLWGGDAGYSWAKKVTAQMDRADEKSKA